MSDKKDEQDEKTPEIEVLDLQNTSAAIADKFRKNLKEAWSQNASTSKPVIVAPVDEPMPLTGKEKAGVSLTWGIIAVLVGFLLIMLIILGFGEISYSSNLSELSLTQPTPEQLEKLTELTKALEEQKKEFRAFWKELLQLVLLNILFPTLTALLGYVFGTSRNNNDNA